MPMHIDPHRRWSESPLPLAGLYPCLTLQLNATYHSVSDSLKWVASIREPSEKVEVVRYSGELQEYERGFPVLLADLSDCWTDLGCLRRSKVNR